MPYSVPLPKVETQAGWKVKIYDNEGAEVPHVSVIRKAETVMRISLRTWMPLVPPGGILNDLPENAVKTILNCETQTALPAARDERFPHNPVRHEDVSE